MRKTSVFKMGHSWLRLFMSPKKINKGWTTVKDDRGLVTVIKPDGSFFGKWDPATGLLQSNEHIMNVQP